MNSETHLIVLWANARSKEKEILEDIQHHLCVCRVFDITWSPEHVTSNYARFYGLNQSNAEKRTQECGCGSLLCIVVKERQSSTAQHVGGCNAPRSPQQKLNKLKDKYLLWTGGSHRVYTSCTQGEVSRDSALLLGLNYEDLCEQTNAPWSGQEDKLQQDITGASGWKDWRQFFYTLNATLCYVLLRGKEWVHIGDTVPTEHGDVDILVRDASLAGRIIGGKTCYKTHTRKKQFIKIGEQQVYIDLWDTANSYHDAVWEQDILKHYDLEEPLMRVPSLRNQFYLLIYHCLIHKRKVAEDYRNTLRDMACQLNCYDPAAGFDQYFGYLKQFMGENNYKFTRPSDTHCFYCSQYEELDDIIRYLESHFSFSDIHPVQTEQTAATKRLLLSCRDTNHNCLILRISKSAEVCKSEYHCAKRVYGQAPEQVLAPLYFNEEGKWCFVALPQQEFPTLQELSESGSLSSEQRHRFEKDLEKIADALLSTDIVHRDIQPRNILVRDEHLVLTNFQYSVVASSYQEPDWLKQEPELLSSLGGDFAEKTFAFDDAFNLLNILKYMGTPASSPVYQHIQSQVRQKELHCISSNPIVIRIQLLLLSLKRCLTASSDKRKLLKREISFIKHVYKNQYR